MFFAPLVAGKLFGYSAPTQKAMENEDSDVKVLEVEFAEMTAISGGFVSEYEEDLTAHSLFTANSSFAELSDTEIAELSDGLATQLTQSTFAELAELSDSLFTANSTLSHYTESEIEANVTLKNITIGDLSIGFDEELETANSIISQYADSDIEAKSIVSQYADSDIEAKSIVSQYADSDMEAKSIISHYADSDMEAKSIISHYADSDIEAKSIPSHYADSDIEAKSILSHYADSDIEVKSILSHYADSDIESNVTLDNIKIGFDFDEELETANSTLSCYEDNSLAETIVSLTGCELYPQLYLTKLELPQDVASCYTPKPEPIDFGEIPDKALL